MQSSWIARAKFYRNTKVNAMLSVLMCIRQTLAWHAAGSSPKDSSGNFRSGCLLRLDTSGNVANEAKSTTLNGPWGMVCTNGPAAGQVCVTA